MTSLIKYNAARTALAEAHAVDEVKDIRDKAEAMAAYARQAKDTEMIAWVTEIKVRAERRAGQLLAAMPKNIGAAATRSHDVTALPPTLSDIGITKNESSRWQKLAAVSDEKFEHAVCAAKEVAGEVTTAAMLRVAKDDPALAQVEGKTKPVKAPTSKPPETDNDTQADEIEALRAEAATLRAEIAELALTAKELLEENASMAAVFESDDKLGAAMAELKKLRELTRVLEERNRGLVNEKAEATRAAKSWKGKFERLERGHAE